MQRFAIMGRSSSCAALEGDIAWGPGISNSSNSYSYLYVSFLKFMSKSTIYPVQCTCKYFILTMTDMDGGGAFGERSRWATIFRMHPQTASTRPIQKLGRVKRYKTHVSRNMWRQFWQVCDGDHVPGEDALLKAWRVERRSVSNADKILGKPGKTII